MKHQVIVIHGGEVYDTHKEYIAGLKVWKAEKSDLMDSMSLSWKNNLKNSLGEDYEVFSPEMPNWLNAKYAEWKIWFDKVLPFLHAGPVFIGHSLGGIFLAKYFAENADKKKARGIFLVAAPFTNTNKEKMADFILPKDLSKLDKLGERLHLYHSQDDPVVSYADVKKYAVALPRAQVTVFKDRGHFRQEKFPELVKDIKDLYR